MIEKGEIARLHLPQKIPGLIVSYAIPNRFLVVLKVSNAVKVRFRLHQPIIHKIKQDWIALD